MELHTLSILVALVPLLGAFRTVIKYIVEKSSNTDIYTLSDAKGHKIQVVVNKRASDEERASIINEKARELTQHQTA